jgi:UDP-2-acetamido-2,6-beta-L-arabino-hexul-4-ose reductase
MKIIVTGSTGFIGKNLVDALRHEEGLELFLSDSKTSIETMASWGKSATMLIHLAGYSRTHKTHDVYQENLTFTQQLINVLPKHLTVLFTSTNAVTRHHRYVETKYAEEQALLHHFQHVHIFRLDNVFGKWAKPFYNSVIATFIVGEMQQIPYSLFDEDQPKKFIYIDDLVERFLAWIHQPKDGLSVVEGTYEKTPREILNLLRIIKDDWQSQRLLPYPDAFQQRLAITWMSYLQPDHAKHTLVQHKDERGSLIEVSKDPQFGQWSINEIQPQQSKGNHYHRIRYEKFVLLRGQVTLKWRYAFETSWQEIVMKEPYHVMDIPPGVIHQLTNDQTYPATLLMWSSIVYDPSSPDTYLPPL